MNRIQDFFPAPLIQFIRLSRPLFLVGGFLMYALGIGIARYLGVEIDWQSYWLGQGCVTMMQLSAQYLNEYYDSFADQGNPNRTPFSGGSGEQSLPRQTALLAAATCLTIGAALTVLLYRDGRLNPASGVILGLAFLGSFFYSVPPIRLTSTGYGELTTSVLVANLVPAFAYSIQTGEIHRLLGLVTFPLALLHLAMLLAFSLPDYGTDLKFEKRTLMVRMGWQKGMALHNVLILSAYLLMGAALFQGFPWRLAWPGFLTLPIGLFQIWQMNQIAVGEKPRWTLLTFTALVIFGLTAYFLTLAFWTS